jgi:hypothetical protein
MVVGIERINVRLNTTVFSNCRRKQLHVSALFWVGHHQVQTRTSEADPTNNGLTIAFQGNVQRRPQPAVSMDLQKTRQIKS